MANTHDLKDQSGKFAELMQELLNNTVCDNARFNAFVDQRDGTAVAGTGLTRHALKSVPMRLRSVARTPLWLDVFSVLSIEERENTFLQVKSSFFGLSVGHTEDRRMLLHYDYERDKVKYPEAHIQVYGQHPEFEAYAKEVGARETLDRYHLPVGGRRMRPCLEDVIEFLITEKLVDPHLGWEESWRESRKKYRTIQIKALVRTHHKMAFDELIRIGYELKYEVPKQRGVANRLKRLLGIDVAPEKVAKKSKKH